MPRFVPVLLAFLLLPATAQAAHQQELIFDKQEIFQKVAPGGAVTTTTASCSTGYRVISGSVRVDTVPGGALRNVKIRTSAPGSDDRRWFYELVNTTSTSASGGQEAQVKLMISCVKPATSGGSGAQHAVSFANRFDQSTSVAAGREFGSAASLDCSGTGPADAKGYVPAGTGWVFDPLAGYDQLVGTQPSVAQIGSSYLLGDNMNFELGGNRSQVAYTLHATVRCLRHLTGIALGENRNHQHYLDATIQLVYRQITRTQGGHGYMRHSVSCPSGYYGVAPTWSIGGASNTNGLKLVGIGYQGDQDVFDFVNPNGDQGFVSYGVICVGTKTSFTDSASASAGPGPQKLLMSQRSFAARIGGGDTLTTTRGCKGKTDLVTAGGISGAGADELDVVSAGGAKATKWTFVLRNTGSTAAPVRLWVKCLSPWAEGHTLVLDGLPSAAPDGVQKCKAGQIPIHPTTEGSLTANVRFLCLERHTTQRINHTHKLNTKTVSRVLGSGTETIACAPHYQAVAPRVTPSGNAQLVRSYPDGRGWTFAFAGNGRSTVSVTCLKDGTTPEVAQEVTLPLEEAPAR